MKRDSQANELAEQRTLLPGERELLAKSGATGVGTAALLKVFRCEALSGVASGSTQRVIVSWPYFAPGDTNVFARPYCSRYDLGETRPHFC